MKAQSKANNDIVAIKKMKQKFRTWEECIQLREIKSLKKLNHSHIVKLKEVIRENDELCLIFEFLDCNLRQYMEQSRLSEQRIRSFAHQLIDGVCYLHNYGFFHRDLKPENMLISNNTLKIADFGLAREIRSRPPYTEYVSTRWYRAPEVLLRSSSYNAPIDLWAIGCIIAEMYLQKPLFPGKSEADQIFYICSVLGPPNQSIWPEGMKLSSKMGFRFPNLVPKTINTLLEGVACPEALQLINDLLRYEPEKRPSASQCLHYSYFTKFDVNYVEPVDNNNYNLTAEEEYVNKKPKNNFGIYKY